MSLWDVAKSSLDRNTVKSGIGPLTVAGAHQFKTFWVRDFCYAVPGLMALGRTDQVRDQLAVCLEHQRADGLIARGFDIINPKLRVVAESFYLPVFRGLDYASRPLKPEYLGEHGTPAVDSNLLVILCCLDWSQRTGDGFFFEKFGARLLRAFEYARRMQRDGLLRQPAFSDWQDSVRREGATFYLNALFLRVVRRLAAAPPAWRKLEDRDEWTARLFREFFDRQAGMFRDQPASRRFTLESQLWCVDENLFDGLIDRRALWENLRKSPLWHPLPGRPVFPGYDRSDVSWTTKAVGLRHYHDGFFWSWLMADSLRVARAIGSKADADRIFDELSRLAAAYGVIHEIYEDKGGLVPVRRPLYRSEAPFSWGAAKIIEAINS